MNMVITNRDLLRKYRHLRDKLLSGEVDSISIPQKTGIVIRIVAEKKESHFSKMTKLIKKHPFINLTRPEEDIF